MPWFRWSVLVLPSRRKGFKSRSVHVGFVVEKMTKGHVFLRVLPFFLISIIQQTLHIHSFIHYKRYKILIFRASSSITKGSTIVAPAINTKSNFFTHMKIAASPPPTHTHTLQPKDFSAFMENGSRKITSDNFK
jgi:hypothetical protein